MNNLLVSQFKAKCVEVLNTVSDTGEAVVVTRRGKPLAKIVPLQASGPRRLGTLAGEAREHGDIVHVGFGDAWESIS